MTTIPTLLKLTAALLTLFAASIAIIHTEPYDAAAGRAVTTQEGCPSPCFMGIRPGMTTGYDALELLRTNSWVRYIQNINVSTGTRAFSGSISWEWSGRQPAWIDPHHDSWLWMGENHVEYITLRTNVSLGEIWLAYGAPASGTVFSDSGTRLPVVYYEAIYPRHHMLITARGACPFRNFWSEAVLITFRDDMPPRLPALRGGSGLPRAIRSQCNRMLNERGMLSP